jgi:peroxiredoxin
MVRRAAVLGLAALGSALVAAALSPRAPAERLLHARGRPVATAYVFFNSLCSGCRAELPRVRTWLASHPRYEPVGVAFREDARSARRFGERYGLPVRVVADRQGRLGRRLGVRLLVQVVVVRDGRVTDRYRPEAA